MNSGCILGILLIAFWWIAFTFIYQTFGALGIFTLALGLAIWLVLDD